jgi:hypothetical protein
MAKQDRGFVCCDQHTGNRIIARLIPVLLVGAAGFATWVFIVLICVNSLIWEHGETGLAGTLLMEMS